MIQLPAELKSTIGRNLQSGDHVRYIPSYILWTNSDRTSPKNYDINHKDVIDGIISHIKEQCIYVDYGKGPVYARTELLININAYIVKEVLTIPINNNFLKTKPRYANL